MGTSWSIDLDKLKPLMSLVEKFKDPGSKATVFGIRMGSTIIGELHLNDDNRNYTLHWLRTGGNFSGSGELPSSLLDLDNTIAQAILVSHIFNVLSSDQDDYVADNNDSE